MLTLTQLILLLTTIFIGNPLQISKNTLSSCSAVLIFHGWTWQRFVIGTVILLCWRSISYGWSFFFVSDLYNSFSSHSGSSWKVTGLSILVILESIIIKLTFITEIRNVQCIFIIIVHSDTSSQLLGTLPSNSLITEFHFSGLLIVLRAWDKLDTLRLLIGIIACFLVLKMPECIFVSNFLEHLTIFFSFFFLIP